MPKYISGRTKRTPQNKLTDDRYQYLGLEQAEPNLGDPTAALPSVPIGQQYQVVSIVNHPGERYWVVKSGGIIPGSISLFDEGSLVGTADSITQVDFRGNAVTAIADPYIDGVSTGVAGTITVRPPGDNGSVLFKELNDFATSTDLVFNTTVGILTVGNGLDVGDTGLNVGVGGTFLTVTSETGYVGIGTTVPTQELHLIGDLRLEGTIYDFNNDAGNPSNLLSKGADGVEWISSASAVTGAGGTIYQVQYHNTAGLVDGAEKLVYTANNDRVGIGSTQPTTLLDVLGPSIFTDGVTIDRLYVTGISTFLNVINANGGIVANSARVTDLTQGRVVYVGPSGELVDSSDLTFDGSLVSSGVNVSGTTTTVNLNVTGVATAGNVKISGNTVQTSTGGLTLDSTTGTVTVADILAVSDTTYSGDKDSGAVVIEGGVGIEKNLNVGENFKSIGVTTLASAGGITTTGGDLYVGGALYVNDSTIVASGVFQRLLVTGISTFKDDVEFHGNTGVTSIFFDKDENSLKVLSSSKLVVGTDTLAGANNLDIYNSGGYSYISGIGTFDLRINSEIVRIGGNSGKSNFVGIESGSSILYFNDVAKLQTSGIGITVTGVTSTTSAYVTNALTVDGDTRLNGSSIYLGSDNLDNIYFEGEVNSNILPNTPNTFNLGSDSKRWNTVYAVNLEGLTNVDIENLFVTGIATFKNDTEFHGIAGVSSAFWDKDQDTFKFLDHVKVTWGNDGDLEIYHDSEDSYIKDTGTGNLIIDGSQVDITGSTGVTLQYNNTTQLQTIAVGATVPNNLGIGSFNVAGVATFYGPVHDKDGQVGAAGSLLQSTGSGVDWVNATGLSVNRAEQVRISQKSNDDTYFLTFVDSNVDASFQVISVDDGADSLTWNPSTNLLTVQNIKPISIQDSDGGSGTGEQVITADGSGGWSWENNESGGIGTVFVKQFTKESSSSTAPFIPVPVERTCFSYITVDQTTAGIATIGIAETSNAYGNRYAQSDDPTSVDGGSNTVCDGDFWYDTTDSAGSAAAGGMTIQDEGVTLSTVATTLNFAGAGVVASGTGATKLITISGGGSGITVADEGGDLSTLATKLNFVGSGVVATGTGAEKTITISGGGGGGSIASRTTKNATTASLSAAASGDLSITAFKAYNLLKIAIDHPAWVRLYVDAASRTSDASRVEGTDPLPGSGVIAEVLTTTAGASTFLMSPGVIGWNNDGTPSTTVYAKVTNKDSSARAITVTLTLIQAEA